MCKDKVSKKSYNLRTLLIPQMGDRVEVRGMNLGVSQQHQAYSDRLKISSYSTVHVACIYSTAGPNLPTVAEPIGLVRLD